jgi:hypothetical protein
MLFVKLLEVFVLSSRIIFYIVHNHSLHLMVYSLIFKDHLELSWYAKSLFSMFVDMSAISCIKDNTLRF